MRILIDSKGSTKRFENFLRRKSKMTPQAKAILAGNARKGVEALRANTPSYSGLAANSWDYEIVENRNGVTLYWTNTNIENGFKVVIALQYGYVTGTGGYVQGRDFINPSLKPIFDQISKEISDLISSDK